jgi:hypothetical protein
MKSGIYERGLANNCRDKIESHKVSERQTIAGTKQDKKRKFLTRLKKFGRMIAIAFTQIPFGVVRFKAFHRQHSTSPQPQAPVETKPGRFAMTDT